MEIDEPITITGYDPLWLAQFAAEKIRLADALAIVSGAIEHIGSTAVPGLSAKAIVDIMVGSKCFPPDPDLRAGLTALGYEVLGEAGVLGRIYCRKRDAVSFNVHIVQRDGEHWRNNLLFRDYLIAHPVDARRYNDAKIVAFGTGHTTLLAYSRNKAAIIAELMVSAFHWKRMLAEAGAGHPGESMPKS